MMAEEIIRYGAGGIPYKGGSDATPVKEEKKTEEKKSEAPKVEVSVTEKETEAEDISELGIEK